MKALDTNLVVRLIVRDDPIQFELARAIIEAGPVFLSLSVLMECEWVLRSRYGFSKAQTRDHLSDVIRLENVTVADRAGLKWALTQHGEGADFADMIHLVMAGSSSAFVTFDRNLVQRFALNSPLPLEILQANPT